MTDDALTIEHFIDISEFPYKDIFNTLSNPWDVLHKINPYITAQFSEKKLIPNYQGRDNVFIGEGTVIESGVEIKGPAIIGRNCVIGHGSLLRDGCIMGDNVHIGHAIEVKHAIILNNTAVAHFNYVGDSILGNRVNLSGGSITANFRLDKKPAVIKFHDKKIETNLLKFGAIIGDDCNIGVNAVLNPATLLGKNCIVYPLQSVTGYHKENEIIK